MIFHQKPSRAACAAIVFAFILTFTAYAGFSKPLFQVSKAYSVVRQLSAKLTPIPSGISFSKPDSDSANIHIIASSGGTKSFDRLRIPGEIERLPRPRGAPRNDETFERLPNSLSHGRFSNRGLWLTPEFPYREEFDSLKAFSSVSKRNLAVISRAAHYAKRFFEKNPAALQATKKILLPEIAGRDDVAGFTVTYDLAFNEALLFVVAELARQGTGIYLVVAPDLNQAAVVKQVNQTFGLKDGKELLTAKDEREAAQVFLGMGVRYKVLLTSQEIHREAFRGVYQWIHVLTDAMRKSIKKGMAGISRALILVRDIERIPAEAA